jgi:hypothetical protein
MAGDESSSAVAIDFQPEEDQQQGGKKPGPQPIRRTVSGGTAQKASAEPAIDFQEENAQPAAAKQPREKNAWGGWDPTAAMDPFTGEHGNPEKPGGFLNYAGNKLGELEDWATGKRDVAEEANLSNVARGGKAVEPGSLGDRASYYDAAARVARFGRGAISPIGVGATAATVAAPTIMGPVLVAHGGYNAVKHAPGALEGNPEEAEQALGGLAEATGGAAVGRGSWMGARGRAQAALPEGETPTVRQTLAQTEPARAMRAAGEVLSPITERLRVPEAPKALTQAIQPGVNIPRAQESIGIAGPRLQQLKQAGRIMGEDGEPLAEFKSPADLLQGVKSAKAHVWDAIEDRLGPVGDLARANTSPVADAMEASVSKRTASQFPKTAEAIKARAATYRDGMSLRDIENAIQDANNDLRNFYKRPGATDSPTGPDMAATEAEVKALRSLLDKKVADLRGSGVKDLKREYGALRDVEKAAARANAVATRQKGATLWEGLAALRAAGDFVSGNVLGAARGAGTLAVGRWLAKLRDPNFLIDKAFQGSKAFQPAGAIERPPIDVAQGEFAAPIRPSPEAPPVARAGVQSATRMLPSAERLQLPGRTEGQQAVVTPEPQGRLQLTTPLGEPTPAGLIPRRALPPAGGVNELPRREGEPIITGAHRALPPASPFELAEARTPKTGVRTVGGRILDAEGNKIGSVAERGTVESAESGGPILRGLSRAGRPLLVDEIIDMSGMSAPEAMAELNNLEMQGRIRALPGGRYALRGEAGVSLGETPHERQIREVKESLAKTEAEVRAGHDDRGLLAHLRRKLRDLEELPRELQGEFGREETEAREPGDDAGEDVRQSMEEAMRQQAAGGKQTGERTTSLQRNRQKRTNRDRWNQ